MSVATFSNKRAGHYLGECNSLNQINEEVIIASGAGVLEAGTVLGRIYTDAPGVTVGTPVSGTGGTVGNGAITAASADAGAPAGNWRLVNTVTGATGKFEVFKPDGSLDGILTIGTPYNGTINISVADGANDWLVGDIIPVTVAYDDTPGRKYVLHDASLSNGGQNAAAILFDRVDATSADVKAVATVRGPATINGNDLTFKSGISATNKANAIEALRAKGMVVLPQHAA